MTPSPTIATAARVLRQLGHDRRTLVIVAAVPLLMLTLLHYLFSGREPLTSRVELQMLAVFPVILMFLLTAIAMVRERTSGTLERLMSTPIGRGDIVAGYAAAFAVTAIVQVALTTAWCYLVLGTDVPGPLWAVLLAAMVSGMLGVGFGLLASAVSRSEFQAVQMLPAIIIPQLLLSGLFGDRDGIADWLQRISDVLPVTYAVESIGSVFTDAHIGSDFWLDVGIVAAVIVALLALASVTLRRRTE